MAEEGQRGFLAARKVVVLPQVRRTSLALTLLEFAHSLVLMLWVGSLAGFCLIAVPVLSSSLPSKDLAARAILAILERTAFLGCGAGAFLLLTTLLMHVASLRRMRATIVQMLLLLGMTAAAVVSQIALTPRIQSLLADLRRGDLAIGSAALDGAFRTLLATTLWLLSLQIAAGIGVLLFAVRRWYRYLPSRGDRGGADAFYFDPRYR